MTKTRYNKRYDLNSATQGKSLQDDAGSYGPLPGPNGECLEVARRVSKFLENSGVTEPGVIGVAYGIKTGQQKLYCALSPELEGATLKALNQRRDVGNDFFLIQEHVRLCTQVSVLMEHSPNPGCAEKKLITWAMTIGAEMKGIGIITHPPGFPSARLSSYIVRGTGSDAVIEPCPSCKACAKFLPKPGG